jgi:hypothetical protein
MTIIEFIRPLKEKQAVINELERLKQEQLSDTKCNFFGSCGKVHTINTELEADHGIQPGQFITLDPYGNKLFLCVGNGKMCKAVSTNGREVLWFCSTGFKGLICFDAMTFRELAVTRNAVIID